MREVKKRITEEEFTTLKKMSRKEQEKYFFPDGIPLKWACGTGYYGHSFIKENGETYVAFHIGNSCD